MKKTIFLLVSVIITAHLFSQTQKGYWMISTSLGSTGYSSNHSRTTYSNSANIQNSDGSSFNFSISPSAMFFIKENLAVGAGVGLNFNTSNSDNTNSISDNISMYRYKSTSFSIGPRIRNYFGEPGTTGQAWIEASANISSNPYKSETTNSDMPNSYKYDFRTNNWNAGANFGYSHFVSSVIAVQYYIGYRHYHYSSNTDYKPDPGAAYSYETVSDSDNINFGVGLQIHLASASVRK